MKICFGMAARNEEQTIATTLESLFAQSVFRSESKIDIEFICVANCCTDQTARAARESIEQNTHGAARRIEVLETDVPGKNHATNYAVHTFSHPQTDYFFFMDADIRLIGEDVIEQLIRALEEHPDAFLASDRPVKHIAFKQNKSLWDRISLAAGQVNQSAPGQICGQLYAARGEFMRRFWLPHEIIQDDGFVKKMAVTNFLREPDDAQRRIVSVPSAQHVFESYTRLADIYATQRRQMSGYMIHEWHWSYLKSKVQPDRDAGQIIRQLQRQRPNWSSELVEHKVRQGDTRRHLRIILNTRLQRWGSGRQKAARLPLLALQSALDCIVYSAAKRALKNRAAIWRDTQSATQNITAKLSEA